MIDSKIGLAGVGSYEVEFVVAFLYSEHPMVSSSIRVSLL